MNDVGILVAVFELYAAITLSIEANTILSYAI